MRETIVLKLTRVAKGSGGDRYEGAFGTQAVVIYFPQEITRDTKLGIAETIELNVRPKFAQE